MLNALGLGCLSRPAQTPPHRAKKNDAAIAKQRASRRLSPRILNLPATHGLATDHVDDVEYDDKGVRHRVRPVSIMELQYRERRLREEARERVRRGKREQQQHRLAVQQSRSNGAPPPPPPTRPTVCPWAGGVGTAPAAAPPLLLLPFPLAHRATCPVCGKEVSLPKHGGFRKHKMFDAMGRFVRCPYVTDDPSVTLRAYSFLTGVFYC